MSIGGVETNKAMLISRIGVDPNGNPVVFDPNKVKNKKQSLFIEPHKGLIAPTRAEIAKKIEAKLRQEEAIKKALEEKGYIDPRNDKVYLDSDGNLDTWKPGIIDPHAKEKQEAARKRTATVLGGLAALALGFLFRGKIKAGAAKLYEAVKPFVKNALTKGKDVIKKGVDLVKPAVTNAAKTVKTAALKVFDTLKGFVK